MYGKEGGQEAKEGGKVVHFFLKKVEMQMTTYY